MVVDGKGESPSRLTSAVEGAEQRPIYHAAFDDVEYISAVPTCGSSGLTAGAEWIRTCMGLSCQVVFLVCWRFLVRSGKAVLRPVACDQVRGARGRGQGTETLVELSGLPLRRACVSQRLDA